MKTSTVIQSLLNIINKNGQDKEVTLEVFGSENGQERKLISGTQKASSFITAMLKMVEENGDGEIWKGPYDNPRMTLTVDGEIVELKF